ncbi:unnamed protein product [Staurois parvus]|uniref:Ribosomal RNA-processing protein 7 C-terminal domain-containing protein n=1 Tax=Staurois parvus TaxID=386267 RepID=A0ABN9GYK0_9NEOB|nr:unnamed protein product [Staurois parvus]
MTGKTLGVLFLSSAQKKEEEAKEEEEPDEEGWVTVTRKGRRPGLARTEAANIRVTEKEKKKRGQKELLNFYAFQSRKSKKECRFSLLQQKYVPMGITFFLFCIRKDNNAQPQSVVSVGSVIT